MRKSKSTVAFASLRPSLIGLGFAFYGDGEQSDPEATILDILRLSENDPKVFRMLLSWLDKTRDLIHVERLRVLAGDLTDKSALIFLGVLALKQVKCGDRRFSILVDFVKSKSGKGVSVRPSLQRDADPFLMEKYGVDLEFQEFGIESEKTAPADPKKILTLEAIMAQNPWLRFRALIGANFRADMAYVMAHKLAQNPYQAAKLVGCSQETAYRLWKGLLLYPQLGNLAA